MGTTSKIIWALYGNVRLEGRPNFHNDFRQSTTKLLRAHGPGLEEKGYTLAIPNHYMTQKGFWNLIADSTTYGIIWFSHSQFNFGRISPVGWDGLPIYMSDVHGVSKNLQFAAILGCKLKSLQYEWAKTLNLRRFPDYRKRMVVYDEYLVATASEDENRWKRGVDTIRHFLKGKSNQFSHVYHYPTLVEKLP